MWAETKHGLYKQFTFSDFKEAFAFMTQVAALAEQAQHHPRWENEWRVVQIWLITHEQGSVITEKDRSLAAAIDGLLQGGTLKSDWSKQTPSHQPKHLKLFTDGGSRGNPGPSASGYVLLDMDDKIVADDGVYIGVTTNNQAEYTGLKLGLEAALKAEAQHVDVYMDSMLVVNQMKGIFKIKNRDLWPVHDAVKSLLPRFSKITFTHVPREHNRQADAAVNRALDAQAKTVS